MWREISISAEKLGMLPENVAVELDKFRFSFDPIIGVSKVEKWCALALKKRKEAQDPSAAAVDLLSMAKEYQPTGGNKQQKAASRVEDEPFEVSATADSGCEVQS